MGTQKEEFAAVYDALPPEMFVRDSNPIEDVDQSLLLNLGQDRDKVNRAICVHTALWFAGLIENNNKPEFNAFIPTVRLIENEEARSATRSESVVEIVKGKEAVVLDMGTNSKIIAKESASGELTYWHKVNFSGKRLPDVLRSLEFAKSRVQGVIDDLKVPPKNANVTKLFDKDFFALEELADALEQLPCSLATFFDKEKNHPSQMIPPNRIKFEVIDITARTDIPDTRTYSFIPTNICETPHAFSKVVDSILRTATVHAHHALRDINSNTSFPATTSGLMGYRLGRRNQGVNITCKLNSPLDRKLYEMSKTKQPTAHLTGAATPGVEPYGKQPQ